MGLRANLPLQLHASSPSDEPMAVTDDANLPLQLHASTPSDDEEMAWLLTTINEKGWVSKSALALRPAATRTPRKEHGDDDTAKDGRNVLVKLRSLLLCMQHFRRTRAARMLELQRRFFEWMEWMQYSICSQAQRSTPAVS